MYHWVKNLFKKRRTGIYYTHILKNCEEELFVKAEEVTIKPDEICFEVCEIKQFSNNQVKVKILNVLKGSSDNYFLLKGKVLLVDINLISWEKEETKK